MTSQTFLRRHFLRSLNSKGELCIPHVNNGNVIYSLFMGFMGQGLRCKILYPITCPNKLINWFWLSYDWINSFYEAHIEDFMATEGNLLIQLCLRSSLSLSRDTSQLPHTKIIYFHYYLVLFFSRCFLAVHMIHAFISHSYLLR